MSFFLDIYNMILTVYNALFTFATKPIADSVQKTIDETMQIAHDWGEVLNKKVIHPACNVITQDLCDFSNKQMHDFDNILRDYHDNIVPAYRTIITNTVSMYLGLLLSGGLAFFLLYIIIF